MRRTFKLGSARGVSIRVHPTFGLLLIWVAYQWGVSSGAGLPGMVFGVLVLLAVFGCVLLHELGHAAVAMHYGLKVRDITLLPIGGVARVEHMVLKPRAEILIALAGPLVNLIITLVVTPAVLLVAAARHSDHPLMILLYADEISVAGFLLYIWIANVLLALFNLLPAFPMDGGRVLRAVITRFTDRFTATRIAVHIGQVFAVALMIAGIVAGDVLLPLVGIFVIAAGFMEARFVRMESRLRKLLVGQFALWESGGIEPDVPLAFAVRDGPKDLVVTQAGTVIGMLWRQDVLRHLHGSHREIIVRDVMDRRFATVEVTDSVLDVRTLLLNSNRSAVAVVQDGQYRGIFTSDRLDHVYAHVSAHGSRWRRRARAFVQRLRYSSQ
ncbi:MAG TPA: site-2 protease family protein [Thermomicrobiales bacterium]|nr:site-2 protease family protein [Thermomicrobiales bacterium]